MPSARADRWSAGTTPTRPRHRPRRPAPPAPAGAGAAPPRSARRRAPRPRPRRRRRSRAHGTSVKLVRPGVGRQYHCSGAGSRSTHAAVRMSGAAIAIATVAAVAAMTWPRAVAPAPHSSPPATSARPITLRMSTFRMSSGDPQPRARACSPEHEGEAEDDPAAARQGQRRLEPGGAGAAFRRALRAPSRARRGTGTPARPARR